MHYNSIEKRKFVRARFPCRISIYTSHGHVISTYTENISAGGVRVLIDENLEISSIVGLELQFNENIIVCKGRIVWVLDKESQYKSGLVYYDTGIEFYEISDYDRGIINETIEKILRSEK